MINEFKISLCTIDRVKDFCWITSAIKPDMDIIVGRYIIDAKSIMGIFSVDLSRELVLKISSDDVEECKEIREKLKAFIVED